MARGDGGSRLSSLGDGHSMGCVNARVGQSVPSRVSAGVAPTWPPAVVSISAHSRLLRRRWIGLPTWCTTRSRARRARRHTSGSRRADAHNAKQVTLQSAAAPGADAASSTGCLVRTWSTSSRASVAEGSTVIGLRRCSARGRLVFTPTSSSANRPSRVLILADPPCEDLSGGREAGWKNRSTVKSCRHSGGL